MTDLVLEADESVGGGDLFLGEDVDLSDETVLRNLQRVIEEVVGSARGVRISVLSADQWLTAVDRLVPASLRRGVRQHFHILADPKKRGHLLVGPATLAGLNEKSCQITAEVTYAILKSGTPAPPPLYQRGSADLLAEEVAQRIEVPIFTHNYPREARFCAEMISMLQIDHAGFERREWLGTLMTSPRQFFLAVRKSRFSDRLLEAVKQDEALLARLEAPRRPALVAALASTEMTHDDPLVRLTERLLVAYRAEAKVA
ncbi:hypothetical protein [Miltoncostaea oceani]|uniref:hypothetical protein n=1 Tax=Miltoncostaea oceani TaxID=2843216 RepID=UPI001C3CC3E0|nr:hypothetical protein [Miltoncostaea oceani]